jgi:pimeloyl-ACP methyl ester carboxylesterase
VRFLISLLLLITVGCTSSSLIFKNDPVSPQYGGTTVVFVYGLWADRDGDGNTLHQLGESLKNDKVRPVYLSFEDDLAGYLKTRPSKHILIVGHSLGATKAIEASREYKGVIDDMVLLEPVRFKEHLDENFNVPANVSSATCYLRYALWPPWSVPIQPGTNRTIVYRNWTHVEFCRNEEIHNLIAAKVQRLEVK